MELREALSTTRTRSSSANSGGIFSSSQHFSELPYHLQIDRQTEAVNRCLEQYLRSFVEDQTQNWAQFLHLAEFLYNMSYHLFTKMTQFEALYGSVYLQFHSSVRGRKPILT